MGAFVLFIVAWLVGLLFTRVKMFIFIGAVCDLLNGFISGNVDPNWQ